MCHDNRGSKRSDTHYAEHWTTCANTSLKKTQNIITWILKALPSKEAEKWWGDTW